MVHAHAPLVAGFLALCLFLFVAGSWTTEMRSLAQRLFDWARVAENERFLWVARRAYEYRQRQKAERRSEQQPVLNGTVGRDQPPGGAEINTAKCKAKKWKCLAERARAEADRIHRMRRSPLRKPKTRDFTDRMRSTSAADIFFGGLLYFGAFLAGLLIVLFTLALDSSESLMNIVMGGMVTQLAQFLGVSTATAATVAMAVVVTLGLSLHLTFQAWLRKPKGGKPSATNRERRRDDLSHVMLGVLAAAAAVLSAPTGPVWDTDYLTALPYLTLMIGSVWSMAVWKEELRRRRMRVSDIARDILTAKSRGWVHLRWSLWVCRIHKKCKRLAIASKPTVQVSAFRDDVGVMRAFLFASQATFWFTAGTYALLLCHIADPVITKAWELRVGSAEGAEVLVRLVGDAQMTASVTALLFPLVVLHRAFDDRCIPRSTFWNHVW